MLSLRYISRLISAFINRFKALIVIGVFFGLVFFGLISVFMPFLTSTHQRIGYVGRYSTDNLPEDVAKKLSVGLTITDIDGSVLPGIAESWETGDGGKTWEFKLNPELKWQDGKQVVSSDINYEFSDALVEKNQPDRVKFILDSEFSAFPVIVSKPIFKKGLLGVSDWKVKQVVLAGGYVQKLVISHKDGDKITYKFYPSEERLKLAFKLGEVDTIKGIQSKEPFDSWRNISLEKEVGYNNFIALFINTENEKFAEKEVRQSIAYAINKAGEENERASSPISPFSWAYNPQVKPYIQDLTKTDDIKDMQIKISVLPNLLKISESIQKDLSSAGAVVEVETVDQIPENYDVFLATVDIPKDPDQYSLWHSTQLGTNISRIKNPRIDKLLEDGRTELDQETRKKTYLDFQRFLVEEVPAVFLYHPNFYTVQRN